MTDDQRTDQMAELPTVLERFPIDFSNAFATTPLCCPSRSSFLTGRYAHDTGVKTNDPYPAFRDEEVDGNHVGAWLQSAGYRTGMIGKYFNHVRASDPPPGGWDEYRALLWNHTGKPDPLMLREVVDGKSEVVCYGATARLDDCDRHAERDYSTRVFGRQAGDFINRAEEPWALFLWLQAPSMSPEPRNKRLPVRELPDVPSFMKDPTDKPEEVQRGGRERSAQEMRRYWQRSLRSLATVEAVMQHVFATLDARGQTDRTFAIFTSDHGKLIGEHGKENKLYPYEGSIRIPMRVKPAQEMDVELKVPQLVANIDIPVTLLDVGGADIPEDVDGESILGLLDGDVGDWRDTLYLENFHAFRWDAVHTGDWKYVSWPESDAEELYDLRADPFELENIASNDPAKTKQLKDVMRHAREQR